MLSLLLFASALLPARLSAAEAPAVVAVFSAENPDYRRALSGLVAELGREVPLIVAPKDDAALPRGTRLVAAFGIAAARRRYPDDVALVYLLAPSFVLPGDRPRTAKIAMQPSPEAVLDRLQALNPKIARLGVCWSSKYCQNYMTLLREAAAARGIVVRGRLLRDAGEVDSTLAELAPLADALWLASDPLLLTETVAEKFAAFARRTGIVLLASRPIRSAPDAVFVGVDPFDAGRAAGSAAIRLLAEKPVPSLVYPKASAPAPEPSQEPAPDRRGRRRR